jgi:hypothetical protein
VTQEIDDKLLAAHIAGDRTLLVDLYRKAAEMSFEAQNIDKACFYLTHSYVFALETRHPDCREIHSVLVSYGREE